MNNIFIREVIILNNWHILYGDDPQKDPYSYPCQFAGNAFNDPDIINGTYITTAFFKEFVDDTSVRCVDGKIYNLGEIHKSWASCFPYPVAEEFFKHYKSHLNKAEHKNSTKNNRRKTNSPKDETFRFQMNLELEDQNILKELKKGTSIATNTDACRRAFRLMHFLMQQTKDGWEMKLERTVNGKKEIQILPTKLIF